MKKEHKKPENGNNPQAHIYEAIEVYGSLALKVFTLLIAVIGGIFGYLLIDRVTISQKQAEIEHKQVELAISISKEGSPKVQADMLEILKAAYTSKTNSDHIDSLIKTMEKNINIALAADESIDALTLKKRALAEKASKIRASNEEKQILAIKQKEIEKEISLLKSRPPITQKIESGGASNVSVAIIVGHKQSSPGASNNESGITEYSVAMELSILLVKELTNLGITSTVVYRRTYAELPTYVNSINPTLSISLHAGAFNGKASGSRVLYSANNGHSKKIAEAILQAIIESLGLTNRGISAKRPEDRGGYLLTYVTSPSVILEPFFIDNNSDLDRYQKKKNMLATNIALSLKGLLSNKED